jgi:hypothetical protein
MKYEKIKFENQNYKLPKASSHLQAVKKTPKIVIPQASVGKLTQSSFLKTIMELYFFYNINHSPFSLLSFSCDEKETKNHDNKKLSSRTARCTARFIVGPTLAK